MDRISKGFSILFVCMRASQPRDLRSCNALQSDL